MSSELQDLRDTVKRNCDIANANHAADSTLCVYLLKMREYYRWDQGLRFDAALDEKSLGRWLRAQEEYWETIEAQSFRPLAIDNRRFDPFDAVSVNSALAGEGLVYSAGFGIRGAVHFFLAELDSVRECEGVKILIAGREHARDVSALPAMSMQDTVFIRRDAIARMLWEKAQEASWHNHDTPMRRALQAYGFDSTPYPAIARMVNDELETFVQHELGELQAGALLGREWQELLARALGKPAEPLIRAVRDNIADGLTTLPFLLREFRPAALHFYFSTLGPLRKSLQPALIHAYNLWRETQQLAQLQQLVESSAAYWLSVAEQLPLDDWEHRTVETFVAAHAL